MDEAGPAVAAQLVDAAAGVGGPGRAEPVVACGRAALQISAGAAAAIGDGSARRRRRRVGDVGSAPARFHGCCHDQRWFSYRCATARRLQRQRAIGVPLQPRGGGREASASRPRRRCRDATPALDRRQLQQLAVLGDGAARDLAGPGARAGGRSAHRTAASVGLSASIIPLMTPRIAVAEQAPPLAVAISREKKYLSSNTPTGVAMYLLLVTRETVDSCRPSSLGDLAQAERLHRHRPELEEVLLALQDRLGDHQDRREALLHVLHRPARLLQVLRQLAVLALRCSWNIDGVGLVQLDARHDRPVERRRPAAADLAHDHVGGDVLGRRRLDVPARAAG